MDRPRTQRPDALGVAKRATWVLPLVIGGSLLVGNLTGLGPHGIFELPPKRAASRLAAPGAPAAPMAAAAERAPGVLGEGAVGQRQPRRSGPLVAVGKGAGAEAATLGARAASLWHRLWVLVRWPLLLLVGAAMTLGASRLQARRARRMQRFLITPGRTSEAAPAQVAGLIEALDRVTRDRWWGRLVRGTAPVATLELVSGSDPQGAREQRIGIALPMMRGQLAALRGVLASRYPDVTLTELGAGESAALRRWLGAVIRLKKAKVFTGPIAHPGERSLTASGAYAEAPLDTVLSVMAETGERVLVQITITPVPNHFQRRAREFARRAPGGERDAAGSDAVEQRVERASAEAVAFRPLAFCDIRVGAESYQAARHVAGAIEGIAEGGENHLRQRCPRLRRRLYVERMVRAESNPLPCWLRGVYSSLEIAALWHLPTPYGKNVAIRRSSVPQLVTPPEVLKPPDARRAIVQDLHGTYIGIRPGDYKYGVQVSGMAGGGKTSILAKIAEVRAREPNTAVIVLDPKGELAEAAVTLMPDWRVVRLLDFARPLFGMALRTADRDLQAEAAIFSEAMVDVSRTEEGESQALNASQRSFKMARQATLALEDAPTFWHTARWLAADDDAAAWRAEKIARLAGDPQWHGVWDHFARILPAQLKKSPTQAVMRLEAPYNKIQTLLGDKRLNTVLHHPVTVSFDDAIRHREVLIVAARVPEHPDGEVLLKFFVQLIHRAILAQQRLPEDERARVAVIGDDAAHLFSPTIARMMEHDRSAGLDMALGWQHGGQVSPELALAIDGLCNSRFYLRSAEQDARRAVNRLNPAYDDRISAGLAELRRKRVEVNQLTNLDVNHAIAVLQTGATLSNSFTVVTIPWQRDPAKLAEFEARMRAEGAYDPEVIAPPLELTGRGENADVDDVGAEGAGAPGAGGEERESGGRAARPAQEQGADGAGSDPPGGGERAPQPRGRPAVRSGKRQAEVAELGTPTDKPLSDAYREVELMRDKAASLKWESRPAEPAEIRHKAPNAEQRAILAALYELRVLSAPQIQREFMMSMSVRQARRELGMLVRQGALGRFELGLRGGRGRGPRVYVLDTAGFAVLRDAADHEASGNWRLPELHSPQHVIHDLARNEWLFAFRSLCPRQLVAWRGPRSGKVEVPMVKEPREAARPLTPSDLRESAPVDFGGAEFANVVPDLTLELKLTRPGGETVQTDLLVEIEFGNNDEAVREKALDYDGFLTGWWKAHARYKAIGRPPIAFFVVPDARRAMRFIELFDAALTSHLVGPAETQTRDQRARGVTPTPKRLYLGRRNIFVAVARDIHQRTLRAWRVPALPPEERIRVARNAGERHRAARAVPRPFMLVDRRDQVDPAS